MIHRSAAILAGGRATRFGGRDKSALVVDGVPIFERQLAALAPLVDEVVIVGGRQTDGRFEGAEAGRVAGRAAIRTIADVVPGSGPLGGIHAALSDARGDAVLVVACDMPYVTAPFAEYLFSLAGIADAVVPRCGDRLHPLCAVYSRTCIEPAAQRLAEGRLALRDLLAGIATRVVTEEEMMPFGVPSRLLANVNTPAEYADLEALQDHKR